MEQRDVEDAVIGCATSVNIACGGHAGDESSMRHAVRVAARFGVAVGAHPSYPDRAGFGRERMDMEPDALRAVVAQQIAALDAIARSEGVSLTHCKPHGALYHAAMNDESVAQAISRACRDHDPGMRLIGRSGSRAIGWWGGWGSGVAREAFADRVYEPDGSLRSRGEPGALITDPDDAAAQALRIVMARRVRSASGEVIPIEADTVCVHADTPNAGAVMARVAMALRDLGVALRGLD